MVAFDSSPNAAVGTDLSPLEAARQKETEADTREAAGDLDGALQCLTKAIFLRPEHSQLYAKRAQLYWELCDIKSAIASYRKVFIVDSDPPQRIKDQLAALLDLHAYSLLLLGESPSIVLGYANEAIQLNALSEVYWLHRAIAHIQACCFDKAVHDMNHCICLNSRDVEYFVLRAKLHWRLHMHEKAKADISKAALLQPDHPEVIGHEQRLLKESQAIYEKARIQLMAHHVEDAIRNLSRATEITPEETKLYSLRASAYCKLGEYHMALRDTEKAICCYRVKIEPLSSIQTSQTLQAPQASNFQRAAHTRVLCITPRWDASPRYHDLIKQRSLILNDIGIRFLKQKSYQLAVNAMNQAIRGHMELVELFREQFTSPQCFLNRGDAYRGLGNFQAALADYHHALELLPQDQSIQSRVALVHYQFGADLFNRALFDKAELEFSNAIDHDSNVPSYYVRRGDAARYLEKHQAACSDYQQALRLNPNDTETQIKLRQYNVVALQASNKCSLGPAKPIALTRACVPQQRRSHELQSNVNDAQKSFKKTNQRVQELFHSRPVVPPCRIDTLK